MRLSVTPFPAEPQLETIVTVTLGTALRRKSIISDYIFSQEVASPTQPQPLTTGPRYVINKHMDLYINIASTIRRQTLSNSKPAVGSERRVELYSRLLTNFFRHFPPSASTPPLSLFRFPSIIVSARWYQSQANPWP